MRVFYDDTYRLATHAFDTTRKAGWIAESLRADPIPGLTLAAPAPAGEDQVRLAHAEAYIHAVRTGSPRALATSNELAWDPGLWTMVCASTGGAIAAALAAREHGVAGSLSSGLHHARHARGAGYCTFNGLVIAARVALVAGARTVLILDLDAHCGGGTHELVADEPRIWHADVAVDRYDHYDLAGMSSGGPHAPLAVRSGDAPTPVTIGAPKLNTTSGVDSAPPGTAATRASDPIVPAARGTLAIVSRSEHYLPAVERALAELEAHGPAFDLCLYNAGMDPYEGCAIGGLAGITRAMLAAREATVFAWCRRLGIPVAFVLAGGYTGDALDEAALVDLHRLTLAAAVGA